MIILCWLITQDINFVCKKQLYNGTAHVEIKKNYHLNTKNFNRKKIENLKAQEHFTEL